MRVLVTCPPMLRSFELFRPHFDKARIETITPKVVQTLSEAELIRLVPDVDGWIIGDDPATRAVFAAGKAGKLRAAVKWGVGVDNVDFAGARDNGIQIANTPQMFGAEVADVAVGYVLGLARKTFLIDRGVRAGEWPKPTGSSLGGKHVALVGYGDIGRHAARRLLAFDMRVTVTDPVSQPPPGNPNLTAGTWPTMLRDADYVVITCALTPQNRHMLGREALATAKPGLRVVNVARGPLIDELALIEALRSGHVESAALDVFEHEPLSADSPLRQMEQCIFGSHNGSNTKEAVVRASEKAISLLFDFLGVP